MRIRCGGDLEGYCDMCGIAGFVDQECGAELANQRIDSMCHLIRHRGPDDQGVWTGDGVALGMRRLSIIDLAGGHQPVFNEDQSVLVVFNGEIYNHRELRADLERRGHCFTTRCDTEAIVHAYEEYGLDCVKHLEGMFVFALWDRTRHRLLLARDRFGKKPLNYYWDGQRLVFGSEIKSLLAADLPRVVHPEALDQYLLYLYVPAPLTMFKGISKLPAGHILVYENEQISVKCYWDLPFIQTSRDDLPTAMAHTRELLTEAVRVRLMSDVPLGAFLSGGVDSSMIVGLMSQLQSQPVKTFSIGFEEQDFSELHYARKVAQHFQTEHHEFFVRPDLIAILPELVWACDEPFADSSMLPTYYVSKLAREHVTVVLTGDGGDEIFGGYNRYKREQLLQQIPAPLRYLAGYGSLLLPPGTRGKTLLNSMRYGLASRYVHRFQHFLGQVNRSTIYDQDYFSQICLHDPYQRLISEFSQARSVREIIARIQCVDVRTYLVDDILVKVDKMSMLNSLETRAPFLDHHLAEYVSSLSPSVRLHHGVLKGLLKQIAADMLPPEILTRRKQGFSVPIKHWFRGDLHDYAWDLLTSQKARDRGIFDPLMICRLLDAHSNQTHLDYSGAIWALVCLELWFQIYLDTPARPIEHAAYALRVGTP
jgi:asparagine synthase (glutamine-hydrolysing)